MQWKRQSNLVKLKRAYRKSPMVLYTGAGISIGKGSYGLSGWKNLLLETARKARRIRVLPDQAEFDALWPDTWACADWVRGRCRGRNEEEQRKNMEKILFKIIRERANYRPSKKQLAVGFLRAAPTLNSVTAFCCDLGGKVHGAQRTTFVCRPNRRIRAVVTTNYDPFLEAAATTMFRKHLLKPVAAYGSPAGTLEQIPVFHIHGYVPYPKAQPKKQRGKNPESTKQRRALSPRLVITSEDYKRQWDKKSHLGTTLTPQVHLLRSFNTLFIGFSFDDQMVVDLLKELQKEREYRKEDTVQHFAVMRPSDFRKCRLDFGELGVKVVCVPHFSKIPECLGEIYQAALAKDYPDGFPDEWQITSPRDYWAALLACRNGYPQKEARGRWLTEFSQGTL